MDEKIYEQEITEESLTASGDTSEPDAPAEEASAEDGDASEPDAPAEDGAELAGIKLTSTLKGPVLRSSGNDSDEYIQQNVANLYTLDVSPGEVYRITFPAEGNSVCVRNDASDTIYLSLKPDVNSTDDEVIPLAADGIVNELYVPAALYIGMENASGDVIVMRRQACL